MIRRLNPAPDSMAISKVRISFVTVGVMDGADLWGDGEWVLKATVNSLAVGDPDHEFVARDRSYLSLPADEWTTEVSVLRLTDPADKITVTFSAKDLGVFTDSELGEVSYVFRFPFDRNRTVYLKSPATKIGIFRKSKQYYSLEVRFEVIEHIATTTLVGPARVAVSRQHDGSSAFTTVGGTPIVPRVEICPVVPTPQAPSQLPPRPDVANANGLTPGIDTPQSQPVILWPLPALNATCNPSVIPILNTLDADLATKAARLAVTYLEPGDLDPSYLTWKVKSGPAEIVGADRGLEVQVIGTGDGAADQMAEFEVRWDGPKGTLLATYRAWVGRIKQVKYRINLINGTNAASRVVFTPQDYKNQMLMARVLFWQAGLDFIPDDVVTTWNRATRLDGGGTALPDGIFIVPVTSNTQTVNVNNFAPTLCSRLNFRPGVVHAVIVRSTATGRAAATDIQGVTGATEELDGKPSSSWVVPSGIPPDTDPVAKLRMATFASSNRPGNPASGDATYVTRRHTADATFTAPDMARLYACVLPSDWTWDPAGSGTDPNAGVNLAHELGHVLGLHHRGSGDASNPPLSNDDINSVDSTGAQRGHPWNENVMTYGYGGAMAAAPRALDIDLIQAPVIRRHPACT